MEAPPGRRVAIKAGATDAALTARALAGAPKEAIYLYCTGRGGNEFLSVIETIGDN
jgi:hypothetical protein